MKTTLLVFLIICCLSCEKEPALTTTLALDGPISPTTDGLHLNVCIKNIGDGWAQSWKVILRLYSDKGKTALIREYWGPRWSGTGGMIPPGHQDCITFFIPIGYTFADIKSYDGVIEWDNADGTRGSVAF
jgi:hypothetical protein